jgi:hypothetical protein
MLLDRHTSRRCWDCYVKYVSPSILEWYTYWILRYEIVIIFPYVQCSFRGYQTLPLNWVVIKLDFGCIIKHVIGYEGTKMKSITREISLSYSM